MGYLYNFLAQIFSLAPTNKTTSKLQNHFLQSAKITLFISVMNTVSHNTKHDLKMFKM
jgi:hypothetical protein